MSEMAEPASKSRAGPRARWWHAGLQRLGTWRAGPAAGAALMLEGSPSAQPPFRVRALPNGEPVDFAAWCAAHPGARCVLWLPLHAHFDLLVPAARGPAAVPRRERLAWARRVFVHYHGPAAAAWPLAGWSWGATHGVAAWPDGAQALPALQATAAAHGVQIAALRTAWPAQLRHTLVQHPHLRLAARARVVLAPGSQALVLETERGVLSGVTRRQVPAAGPQALLPAADILDPRETALLTEPWRTDPAHRARDTADFLRPAPALRIGPRAVVVGVVAAAAVGGLAGWAGQQSQRQRDEATQLAQARLLVPTRGGAGAARAQPLPATSSPTAAEAALLRRLAHPWPAVFAAAEAGAVPGVAWLSLEHQIGGELRLSGLAPHTAAAQQAAGALRGAAPLHQVVLARVQAAPQAEAQPSPGAAPQAATPTRAALPAAVPQAFELVARTAEVSATVVPDALPEASLSPQRAAMLLTLARRAGVQTTALQERLDEAGRLQLQLNGRAPYAALRRFAEQALAADPALVLDRVRAQRESPAVSDLEIELGWTWLHAVPPASSGARGRT